MHLISHQPARWILCGERILVRFHIKAALMSLPPDMRSTELDLRSQLCHLGASFGIAQCVFYVIRILLIN